MSDHEYDVVVVGCGIAGLSAGIRLAERNISVLILEKSPKEHRGGHTWFTESFRLPTVDIVLDVEFNVEDHTAADFYSDLMKTTNYRVDEDLARTVTEEAAETFEWLTEMGINWEYQAPHPGYTAGRVWLDGERRIDERVDHESTPTGVPTTTGN